MALNVVVRTVSGSKVVFNKFYEKERTVKECGNKKALAYVPSLPNNLAILSQQISQEVMSDFLPKNKKEKVYFLKFEDIYYDEDEKHLLENSIDVFIHSKVDSLILFKRLVDFTQGYSSTALFNYALALESNYKYKEALKYYKKAFAIASEQENVDKYILNSINRVEKKIKYEGFVYGK